MPVTVTRLYGNTESAEGALKELKRHRFSSSDIHVVRPPSAGAEDSVVPAIAEGGIPKHRAERYAEAVRNGATLIVVHPPFGSAAVAEEVLDHFNPTDSGVAARDFAGAIDYEDDATPFSRLFGWRVLLHNPAPFSEALGWKTLTKTDSDTYPATFKTRTLSHNPTPLSSALGLPVLSHNEAPLSSATGLRTLSAKASPFSDMLGLKTLTSKQTVSGDVKLSHNPTPLSSALGLPVLTKDQS